MQEREIDLTPRHLVDWLAAEAARPTWPGLRVRASREFLADGAATGDRLDGRDADGADADGAAEGLDAEDEVPVVTTVGLLEVEPPPGGPHWLLRLRIENPIACHLPEDGSVPDGPEEIGLEEFDACFLDGEDTDGWVTLETREPADTRAFERLLARILADRHAAAR